MTHSDAKNGTDQFQNADHISGRILSTWLRRSGIKRSMILKEINAAITFGGKIGDKSFRQWTSDSESARLVSGLRSEIQGERLVSLVRWFLEEHTHRTHAVITSEELRELIYIYKDLPIKFRLQLKRLLHDLEIYTGERETDFSFATDWKNHLAEWPVFCFVLDRYWTVRASTCYEMALAGYGEKDMTHWSWWHRLLASSHGIPKYKKDSPRYFLRGPYTDAYYSEQLKRFKASTESFRTAKDERYNLLMKLLQTTPRFNEVWKRVDFSPSVDPVHSMGIPVPFFRTDDTLLWMLEVTTIIPNTPDYQLIVWVPLNKESAEYQAEIRRWANESGNYTQKVYFIEEFSKHFTSNQCKALGISLDQE